MEIAQDHVQWRNLVLAVLNIRVLSWLRKAGTNAARCPLGTGGSFPVVKRPGREADNSPPSSAEVNNGWSCTSSPPIRLHGVVLS